MWYTRDIFHGEDTIVTQCNERNDKVIVMDVINAKEVINAYDKRVYDYFSSLIEHGANGHDFLEEVTSGKYRHNNRAVRIARLAWRTNASFYEAGKEPYFRNVLNKLTYHVMTFYKVDPGDSDIMRNVFV